VKKRRFVYIDGFNLYYRALKGTPYKWLDLSKLVKSITPQNEEVIKIKYFTARVSKTLKDETAPERQVAYLNALKTITNLEIIEGNFQVTVATRRICDKKKQKLYFIEKTTESDSIVTRKAQVKQSGQFIKIIKTEEKGTDVNIASHMIIDGYKKQYDVAVLISNDSDLTTPVRLIRQELKLDVGVIFPSEIKQSYHLKREAKFNRTITIDHLRNNQFPDEIVPSYGSPYGVEYIIRKPEKWKEEA
jgi:uncharacterized LabA/DUF88 family protein